MFQVDTIQLKRPFGYSFADQKDFLEAQIIAQKEVEQYMKYRSFCKRADTLREKSGIQTPEDLEKFLSD